jgi:hypothetical protein
MAILRVTAAAGLLCAAVAGCMGDAVDLDLDPEVAVHSVLLAGSPYAAVFITRVHPSTAGRQRWIDPVPGADVVLHSPEGDIVLTEFPGSADPCYRPYADGAAWQASRGCYWAALPGGVRTGGRYALSIRLPDGSVVTGETTVPEAPALVAPTESEQVAIRGGEGVVSVRWTPTPPMARVELAVEASTASCWAAVGRPLAYASFVTLDPGLGETHEVRLRGGCEDARFAFPARFVLMSFDTAYARYADEVLGQAWSSHGRASAGLTGALGVFGSAAASDRRVEIVLTR